MDFLDKNLIERVSNILIDNTYPDDIILSENTRLNELFYDTGYHVGGGNSDA